MSRDRDQQGGWIVRGLVAEMANTALRGHLDIVIGRGRYAIHINSDRSAGSRWPHAMVWADLGWWRKWRKAELLERELRAAYDLWIQVVPR